MKQRVGIISMAAKPIHAGHMQLITIAARENDIVKLFVSIDDRKRKDQFPIWGQDMEEIWKTYLQDALPSNVDLIYCKGKSPISHVYEFLGKVTDDEDTFVLYSDPNDMEKNFSHVNLEKYLNKLQKNGQIQLEPVDRKDTVDISGTKMRQFLQNGDKEAFIENLPTILQDVGENIWNQFHVSASVKK